MCINMTEADDTWQACYIQPTDVSVLDVLLPIGFPRNNFVVISGESGTGKKALVAELVYRVASRGEPIILLTTDSPPLGLYHRFRSLGWDFQKLVEEDQIHIVDAFSGLVEEDEVTFKKLPPINIEIYHHLEHCITTVSDEENLKLIFRYIYQQLNRFNMVNQGIIVIDSLTELYSRVGALSLYHELKILRAIACAFRFVPVFGIAHFGVSEEFPRGIDYLMDGLIDLRYDPALMEKGILLKQVRIRKLADTLVLPYWVSFIIRRKQGTIPLINPSEHLQSLVDMFETRLNEITGKTIHEQD